MCRVHELKKVHDRMKSLESHLVRMHATNVVQVRPNSPVRGHSSILRLCCEMEQSVPLRYFLARGLMQG